MNAYANIENFNDFCTRETGAQLSNDSGSLTPYTARIQRLLDSAASWMESMLDGLYNLPVRDGFGNIPPVLTMVVIKKTEEYLYGRRQGQPGEIVSSGGNIEKWLEAIKKERANIPYCQRINGPAVNCHGDPPMLGNGVWLPWCENY